MNELEEDLARALRQHAEGDVHVEALLGGAQRLGRRRRRRHLAGMGAALTVAVLAAAAVTVPALGSLRHGGSAPAAAGAERTTAISPGTSAAATATPASPAPSATPFTSLPRPPRAAGVRPATADPTVVGADPMLLHVDVADAAVPPGLNLVQWGSLGGLERLILQAGGGRSLTTAQPGSAYIQVLVSRDRTQLDQLSGQQRQVRVGGVTGTLAVDTVKFPTPTRIQQVRWRPVPGVWAQIQFSAKDDMAAVRFAEALRFDHVLRCVVPYRLTWVPAGAMVESCGMVFDALGSLRVSGRLTVRLPTGGYVTVNTDPKGASISGTTIAGRPASAREYSGDGGALIFQIDIDYGDRVVDLLAEGKYDKATVLRIAGGYQPVPASAEINSWVTDPLH